MVDSASPGEQLELLEQGPLAEPRWLVLLCTSWEAIKVKIRPRYLQLFNTLNLDGKQTSYEHYLHDDF